MNVHKTKITDSVLGISLNDTTLDPCLKASTLCPMG